MNKLKCKQLNKMTLTNFKILEINYRIKYFFEWDELIFYKCDKK